MSRAATSDYEAALSRFQAKVGGPVPTDEYGAAIARFQSRRGSQVATPNVAAATPGVALPQVPSNIDSPLGAMSYMGGVVNAVAPTQANPPADTWLGRYFAGYANALAGVPADLLRAGQAGINFLQTPSDEKYAPSVDLRQPVNQLAGIIDQGTAMTKQAMGMPGMKPGGIPEAIGSGTANLGTQVLMGAATGGGSLPLQAGTFALTGAAPVVGQTMRDASNELGAGMEGKAANEAMTAGSITALTSFFPGMAILRKVPGGDRAAMKLLAWVERNAAGRLAGAGLAEGGQEYIEGALQDIVTENRRRGKPVTRESVWAAMTDPQRAMDFAIGAGLGAGAHAMFEGGSTNEGQAQNAGQAVPTMASPSNQGANGVGVVPAGNAAQPTPTPAVTNVDPAGPVAGPDVTDEELAAMTDEEAARLFAEADANQQSEALASPQRQGEPSTSQTYVDRNIGLNQTEPARSDGSVSADASQSIVAPLRQENPATQTGEQSGSQEIAQGVAWFIPPEQARRDAMSRQQFQTPNASTQFDEQSRASLASTGGAQSSSALPAQVVPQNTDSSLPTAQDESRVPRLQRVENVNQSQDVSQGSASVKPLEESSRSMVGDYTATPQSKIPERTLTEQERSHENSSQDSTPADLAALSKKAQSPVTIADDAKLTTTEKAHRDRASKGFGRRIVFVDTKANVEGAIVGSTPTTLYVKRGLGGKRLTPVVAHEALHSMQRTNPELAGEVIDAVGRDKVLELGRKQMEQQADAGYAADADENTLLDEGLARLGEEIAASRPEVASRLLETPGLWERFKTWIQSTLNKVGITRGSQEWTAVARALDKLESEHRKTQAERAKESIKWASTQEGVKRKVDEAYSSGSMGEMQNAGDALTDGESDTAAFEGDITNFPGKIPSEVLDLLGPNAAVRYGLRANVKGGRAPDSFYQMGEDRFKQAHEARLQNKSRKARTSAIKGAMEPEAKFVAAYSDLLDGKAPKKAKQAARVAELRGGDIVRIEGVASRVVEDESGYKSLQGGAFDGLSVEGIEAIPVDEQRGWWRAESGETEPADAPKQEAVDLPFSAKRQEFIDVDGTQRPMTNSDGKPIANTDDAIRAFWRWFGDSKVVDAEGRPKIMYHGGSKPITSFDERHTGGAGFYFTPDSAEAQNYARGASGSSPDYWKNITRVYLSAQNPASNDVVSAALDRASGGNPNGVANTALRRGGYDSRMRPDGVVAVFEPSQIKSATGNQGTFNKDNPDIRFSARKLELRGDQQQGMLNFTSGWAAPKQSKEPPISAKEKAELYPGIRQGETVSQYEKRMGTADTPVMFSAKLPDTIEVDGKQRPTTNSDGKPIARTAEEVRNFWKWFGDSKVVDKDGKPLVVYHGTNAEFNTFNKSSAHNKLGPGYYFSNMREYAQEFARDNKRLDSEVSGSVMPVYVRAENVLDVTDKYEKLWQSEPNGSIPQMKESLRNRLIADGYDGLETSGKFVLVAFSSNQIKSATGNKGTFDAANPDIRFSAKRERLRGDAFKEKMQDAKRAAKIEREGADAARKEHSDTIKNREKREKAFVTLVQQQQAENAQLSVQLGDASAEIQARRSAMKNMLSVITNAQRDLKRAAVNIQKAKDKAAAREAANETAARVRDAVVEIAKQLPPSLRGRMLTDVRDSVDMADLLGGEVSGKTAGGNRATQTFGALGKAADLLIRYNGREAKAEIVKMTKPRAMGKLSEKARKQIRELIGDYDRLFRQTQAPIAPASRADAAEQLVKIADDVRAIVRQHQLENKIIRWGRIADAMVVRNEVIESAKLASPELPFERKNPQLRQQPGSIKRGVLHMDRRADVIMRMVDNDMSGNGPLATGVERPIRDGMDKRYELIESVTNISNELAKDEGFEDIADLRSQASGTLGEGLQKFEKVKIGGKEYRLSWGTLAKLVSSFDDVALGERLRKGRPVTFRGRENQTPVTLTVRDEQAIRDALPDELYRVVKGMKRLRDQTFPMVQAAQRVVTGREAPSQPGYEPIITNRDQAGFAAEADPFDANFETKLIENSGFLKERVNDTSTPIIIGDFFEDFDRSIRNAADAAFLMVPLRNAREILMKPEADGSPSVGNTISERFGEKALDRIRDAVRGVVRPPPDNNAFARVANKLERNTKVSLTAVNPGSLAIASFAPLPRIVAEIGLANTLKGIRTLAKKGVRAQMMADSPWLRSRAAGTVVNINSMLPQIDLAPVDMELDAAWSTRMGEVWKATKRGGRAWVQNMVEAGRDFKAGDYREAGKNARQAFTRGSASIAEQIRFQSFIDSKVAQIIWEGTRQPGDTKATHKKRAEDVALRILPRSDSFAQTEWSDMVNRSGWSSVFPFRSDANTTLNHLTMAWSENRAKGIKVTSGFVVAALLAALIKGAEKAMRDALAGDDDPMGGAVDAALLRFGQETVGLPFLGGVGFDFAREAGSFASGGPGQSIAVSPITKTTSGLYKAGKALGDKMTSTDPKKLDSAMQRLFDGLMQAAEGAGQATKQPGTGLVPYVRSAAKGVAE